MSAALYPGLVAAQSLTLAAYAVVTAGVAVLQHKANQQEFFDSANADTAQYNEIFQSSTYIIPYPQRPQYQFQYQWWIIEFQFFIFLITLGLTIAPSYIPRARAVPLTFLATALVLVMDNINAVYYLLRNDTAKQVLGESGIRLTASGFIIMGVANGLTVIFMGLFPDVRTVTRTEHSNGAVTGGNGRV